MSIADRKNNRKNKKVIKTYKKLLTFIKGCVIM
jgi:hypothetical protein